MGFFRNNITDDQLPRALAAVGAAFSTIVPNRRPFDVADPSLSYPLTIETISTGILALVGLVGPAVIIIVLSLLINFCPHLQRPSKAILWRWKLWEWNAGWMGLGLAVALSFLIVSGVKEVAGKPRPDLLARCDPDLSRLPTASVGGIGQQVDEGINLVSWTICRKTGEVLDEGFRSFPSGHAASPFAESSQLAPPVHRADIHCINLLFRFDLPCSLDQRQTLDCYSNRVSLVKASKLPVQSIRKIDYPLSSGRSSHLPCRIPSLLRGTCNIRLFDSIF